MSGAVCNSCHIYKSLHHCSVPPSLTNTPLPTPDVCHCCIDRCYVDLLSLCHDIPMRSSSWRLGFRTAEKEVSQHIELLLLLVVSQYLDRLCSLHLTTAVVLETRNLVERAYHPVHAFWYWRFVCDFPSEPGIFIHR